MKTVACRGKPISDLKSALSKYTESVENSHATGKKFFFVALCYFMISNCETLKHNYMDKYTMSVNISMPIITM